MASSRLPGIPVICSEQAVREEEEKITPFSRNTIFPFCAFVTARRVREEEDRGIVTS